MAAASLACENEVKDGRRRAGEDDGHRERRWARRRHDRDCDCGQARVDHEPRPAGATGTSAAARAAPAIAARDLDQCREWFMEHLAALAGVDTIESQVAFPTIKSTTELPVD
jgi:hypothetical protein